MRILFLVPLLAALAAPAPAPGAISDEAGPVVREETCPIGGARFAFATTRYYRTYGERPDGKPYGSWTFPLALPECPDNGLIVYRPFAREELARVGRLVASPAYRKLRGRHTHHYRAYWLMKAMNEESNRYFWSLVKATWEAETIPKLRRAYLAELAEASPEAPPDPDYLAWIEMQARSINALRELGRFDEALARLKKVPVAGLDIKVPAANGHNATEVTDAISSRLWHAWFLRLQAVIERRDASIEPLDLLPRSVAIGRCMERVDRLDKAGLAFCAGQAEGIETLRRVRNKLDEAPPAPRAGAR